MFLKSYMLAGAGEKMQYLAHEFNDNTIRFVLRYPGRVRGDVLMRAVGTVVERIDVLHASFIARHTTALWHVNREITPGDYFTCVEAQDSADVAVQAALTGISPDAKAQLHCTLVQGENESILALCISHLCVDGGDGKYLLEKICEAYNLLLQEGNAAALQFLHHTLFPVVSGGIVPHQNACVALSSTAPSSSSHRAISSASSSPAPLRTSFSRSSFFESILPEANCAPLARREELLPDFSNSTTSSSGKSIP